jgi:predicted aspartyl protease
VIHGTVVGLQARINVILRPPERSDVEIECVVDTGFEGALTLPPDVVAALKLPYVTRIISAWIFVKVVLSLLTRLCEDLAIGEVNSKISNLKA